MGKLNQPINIVITRSANLNPEICFFQQQVLRWLLTTTAGALFWQEHQRTVRSGSRTNSGDVYTVEQEVFLHYQLQHSAD